MSIEYYDPDMVPEININTEPKVGDAGYIEYTNHTNPRFPVKYYIPVYTIEEAKEKLTLLRGRENILEVKYIPRIPEEY